MANIFFGFQSFILKINTEHCVSIVCSIVKYPFIKEVSLKLSLSLFFLLSCVTVGQLNRIQVLIVLELF